MLQKPQCTQSQHLDQNGFILVPAGALASVFGLMDPEECFRLLIVVSVCGCSPRWYSERPLPHRLTDHCSGCRWLQTLSVSYFSGPQTSAAATSDLCVAVEDDDFGRAGLFGSILLLVSYLWAPVVPHSPCPCYDHNVGGSHQWGLTADIPQLIWAVDQSKGSNLEQMFFFNVWKCVILLGFRVPAHVKETTIAAQLDSGYLWLSGGQKGIVCDRNDHSFQNRLKPT